MFLTQITDISFATIYVCECVFNQSCVCVCVSSLQGAEAQIWVTVMGGGGCFLTKSLLAC